MSKHYDFHYQPTGTGAISGTAVLEQTEDAINDLGNTAISGVQEALDKAQQAFTNSANAVDDAQTALNTANNAEGVAIQAQNDVSNLSGTVTNIGNRVTTAEGNIGNLQGRMTTAEGNIGNLQGRMTTAEGNIGNLLTAVFTTQATANSAQQTATTARQQAYVLRYSSTAITDNSTIAYSTLDNTDNIKADDKIIDADRKIFSIVSVDSDNSTVTVGTALVDMGVVALPIGSYIQFAGSQAPDGFLVCNGGEISRTTYSALFAVIGTTYGSGDGSTTFNLPNLTDRFLQGSSTSGTVKNAGLPNITGSTYIREGHGNFQGLQDNTGCIDVANSGVMEYANGGADTYGDKPRQLKIAASRSNSIYGSSSTVQPPALTCLICIKY